MYFLRGLAFLLTGDNQSELSVVGSIEFVFSLKVSQTVDEGQSINRVRTQHKSPQ